MSVFHHIREWLWERKHGEDSRNFSLYVRRWRKVTTEWLSELEFLSWTPLKCWPPSKSVWAKLGSFSAAPNTGCSCRKLRFSSQHPCDNSQPLATLIPKDLMPFADIHRQACTWWTYIHTYMQIKHSYAYIFKSINLRNIYKKQSGSFVSCKILMTLWRVWYMDFLGLCQRDCASKRLIHLLSVRALYHHITDFMESHCS